KFFDIGYAFRLWPMSHRDIWWVGIIQNHLPTCTNRPYGTTDTTDSDFSTHQWSLCDRMFNLWKLFAATRDFRLRPLSRKDIWWVANIRTVWPMSHRDIWWVARIRILCDLNFKKSSLLNCKLTCHNKQLSTFLRILSVHCV